MAAFGRLSGAGLWGMWLRRGEETGGDRDVCQWRGLGQHSLRASRPQATDWGELALTQWNVCASGSVCVCVCDFPWSLPSIFSGPPRATERVKQGPLQTEEGWRGGGTKGRHQGEHVRSDTQGKSNRAKLHAVVCFSWEEPWEGILRICANLQSPLHHITDTGDNRALESFKDKEKKLHYVDTTKQTDVFSLPPVAALSLLLTCFGNWTFQLWYLKKTSLFP